MKKIVKETLVDVETRVNFTLNKIVFDDGYSALEKNEGGGSSFRNGEEANFSITFPGKAGKLDWIVRESISTTTGRSSKGRENTAGMAAAQPFSANDMLYISQHGIAAAVSYMKDTEGNIDKIVAYGLKFSEGIILNSQLLCNKYLESKK